MTINYFSKPLFSVFYVFLLTLLPGCAMFGSVEDEAVFANLSVIADNNLNPAVDGRASPIVIRIYQLSQTAKFDNSDFFALYENDQNLLANDVQSRTELDIKPKEEYQNQIEIKPDTRFVAVLAAFRDLDNAQWKDIKAFNTEENKSLVIHLNKNSVSVDVK